MAFFDGLKGVLVKWLGILPAQSEQQMIIREVVTREVEVLKNKLWYRGDPAELEQFYKQLASMDSFSTVAQTRFWASCGNSMIRKFHSGIPRMIADKLASIVVEDMNEPEMDADMKARWDEIDKEIDLDELLKESVAAVLSEGDGAFKVCVDTDLSPFPMVEFYSGNNVELIYKRGKLIEIQFSTDYWQETKQFKLVEYYGKGYVRYKLFDSLNRECDMNTLEETAQLQDITFSGDYIMGVPLRFFKSAKWKDRGDSVFEGKGDTFDALDECLSTWMDAIRAGRVKQYIPENLIPRNEENGAPLKPDVFNPYIMIGSNLAEDSKDEIQVKQGEINFEGLLASYTTLLDCCLQGLISPSTLGIDVKKMDNAESQREKEKTTLYTRDTMIGALSKTLPKLVEIVLKTQDNMKKQKPREDYEAKFEWGQYANPSFDSMVETIGKAKTYGIMSIEKCVEELYGDTMSDEDKKVEVQRLKEEANLREVVSEPSLSDDGTGGGVNEPTL